ncbi:MAG: phosphoribosylformylglycinamidine synthase subunit PurQ [Planctomycetes bacterium]|nr:phosphoribosylformylglycinamidine synthase subunit PurQ [Planctomycetota bacterium]
MKPRVLQLFAAGVNCDRELEHAFKLAGADVRPMHVHALTENPALVKECDLFAIPGGFTYGDDLGAGRILALEVATHLKDALLELHEAGGTLFGVCNGFQVLVKTGLLPGIDNAQVSLTWNDTHRFECRWSRLLADPSLDAILPTGTILPAGSAHAEGKLVCDSPETLTRLEAKGCIALRYADENGHATRDYPHCPNGSDGAIAGLISPSGRILGLMPHPERCLSPENLPDRGKANWGDGLAALDFFCGMLAPYGAVSPTI